MINNKYSVYDNYSLYIVDDENINDILLNNKYSDQNDFINIINQKNVNETKIINDLLKLEPRKWYDELKILVLIYIKPKIKSINILIKLQKSIF